MDHDTLALIVGVLVGIGTGVMTSAIGMDRDRALYPALLIVIALYYVLFAVMGGSSRALVIEIGAALVFIVVAVIGFKTSLWITAAGTVGHGLFDLVHARLIDDPGVPVWWPPFCMTVDIVIGLFLGLLLWRKRVAVSGT